MAFLELLQPIVIEVVEFGDYVIENLMVINLTLNAIGVKYGTLRQIYLLFDLWIHTWDTCGLIELHVLQARVLISSWLKNSKRFFLALYK